MEPAPAIIFRIIAGNDQEGPVAEFAPLALAVRAEDATGAPVPGLPVTWEGAVNGRVVALSGSTSATGGAEALFMFGAAEGPAEVSVHVPGGPPARFLLRASGRGSGVPYDALELLTLPTYDGTGQTVHPDYVRTPWPEFSHVLAITPYPGGDLSFENPSILTGGSPLRWTVPEGAENPLVRPDENSFLSDPDVVFVPETSQLWLYYRVVDTQNRILLITSGNGIQWSSPTEVAAVPNYRLISPTIVHRGPGDWWMWSIDGGAAGCSADASLLELRRSSDGLHWGPPVPAPLAHDGLTPWHIDVQWIPSRREFWAVYNAKPPGSCATPALFLATSPDGIAWTPVRQPLVEKGVIPEFRDIVYRTTFRYDAATDDLWLWVSGATHATGSWVWRTALQRRRGRQVMSAVPSKSSLRFRPAPVPLTDWP